MGGSGEIMGPGGSGQRVKKWQRVHFCWQSLGSKDVGQRKFLDFIAYVLSFVAVVSFFRSKDPHIASRTDKFFARALADVDDNFVVDKNLSA